MKETKTNGDSLPPHSVAAERGVLACVLQSPEESLLRLAERRVAADWFYEPAHQTLYAAMLTLHSKRDVPVDAITLQQYLHDSGNLPAVGGVAGLQEIEGQTPSAANLPYYLNIVREKFVMRQAIRVCTEVAGKVQAHEGAIEGVMGDALHDLESVMDLMVERREKHIKDVLVKEVLPQLEEHYTRGKQKLRGLSTGSTYCDKVVRGIRPNYYYVVAARPGHGKTSWAMNVVEHAASQGHAVGVFTLEMTADSLATRLLFSVADVDSGAFEQGFATKLDFEKLTGGAARLASRNIYLDAEPDQSIEMIAAKARRWAKEYNIKLFVLDYLQLLDDESDKYKSDRVQALRRISKKIVSLKNKLNIPWLVLAQMNRSIETAEVKRTPVLSDLKECGAIEQDADVVMFLHEPVPAQLETRVNGAKGALADEFADLVDEKSKWNHRDLIQAVMRRDGITKVDDWPKRVNAAFEKNRYGPTGKAELLFQSNRCRFFDWVDWARAKGGLKYGAGDRESANPVAAEITPAPTADDGWSPRDESDPR